jgi:RNA polymerase sigma-70 factor (ECF subfamily)
VRLPWPIREVRLARLAARASRGDPAAVVALYRVLHPDVSRFVGRRVESRADAEHLLRRRLAELPDATRELLALRFADGLRWSEIAAVLGPSEEALRQRASRTLRELRESLRGADGREPVHE